MNKPEFVTGTIDMTVDGMPAPMELSIPTGKVKPTRMLPVFQKMTDSFVKIAIDKITENGKTISCKAGCGACCRQIVPISKIEAHQIAKIIRGMPPAKRRKVVKRFNKAFETFTAIGLFEKLGSGKGLTLEERKVLGIEYFREGIPCPFLEDESCSIHSDRPLACREYLVTSAAENCISPTPNTIEMVAMPKKPSAALNKISKKDSPNDSPGYIPLISVLNWTDENPDRFPMRSGPEWIRIALLELKSNETASKQKNTS